MKNGYYRLKTWDEMVAEFGLDNFGNIRTEIPYSKEKENDCPTNRVIYIKDSEWNPDNKNYISGWNMSIDMMSVYLKEERPNMTELQKAQAEIKEAEERIRSAQAIIDEIEKKQKQEENPWRFWMPEVVDVYWFIDDCDRIGDSLWDDHRVDYYRLKENNIFKTESDAKRFKKIKQKLYDIAGEVDYGKTLYSILYDREDNTVGSSVHIVSMPIGNICSNNSDFYTTALSQIGIDDLKWFYSYGWRRV